MNINTLVLCQIIFFIVYTIKTSSIPNEYILSFPKIDNYLNISISVPYSKNYFIVIGDWGAPDDKSLQSQQVLVANKLKSYVSNQATLGKNLLFILSVGDNFYMAGQDCSSWDAQWHDVYGNLTRDYYWFGTMGNHDWGYNDLYAMCPWYNTKYTNPNTQMKYASNILNVDKGGCAPTMWEMPDFGYYYTINELNFELIVLDENSRQCPGELFCERADICMACPSYNNCYMDNGNYTKGKHIGCEYLDKIRNASENMMFNRSSKSINNNFILAQHYPDYGKYLIDKFDAYRSIVGNISDDDIIVSVYGHAHKQNCDGIATDSFNRTYCNLVLSGGGGGCCLETRYKYERAGFYVMGFDDNGYMIQLVDIFNNNISFNNSGYVGIQNINLSHEITDATDIKTISEYTCPVIPTTTTIITTSVATEADSSIISSTIATYILLGFCTIFIQY